MAEFLTLAELAERLGISETKLSELRDAGVLPCVEISPKLRRYVQWDCASALIRAYGINYPDAMATTFPAGRGTMDQNRAAASAPTEPR